LFPQTIPFITFDCQFVEAENIAQAIEIIKSHASCSLNPIWIFCFSKLFGVLIVKKIHALSLPQWESLLIWV